MPELAGSWKSGVEEKMESPTVGPGWMIDPVSLRLFRCRWEAECLRDSGVAEWQVLWVWDSGRGD